MSQMQFSASADRSASEMMTPFSLPPFPLFTTPLFRVVVVADDDSSAIRTCHRRPFTCTHPHNSLSLTHTHTYIHDYTVGLK